MKTSRLCAVVLTTFLACLPLAAQQIVDWISGDTLPPLAMAANPVAHKIYVADGLLFTGGTTINVINEQDDGITDVNVGNYPIAIGVNSATGSAYVLNYTDHTVTAVDSNNQPSSPIPVILAPAAVGVNTVTNKIYVGESRAASDRDPWR